MRVAHAAVRDAHAGAHAARSARSDGTGERVALVALAAVPGLRPAARRSAAARRCRARATLLARDGSVLAEEPAGRRRSGSGEATRSSPLGEAADAVVGDVGPIARRRAAPRWKPKACPATREVGVSGLELRARRAPARHARRRAAGRRHACSRRPRRSAGARRCARRSRRRCSARPSRRSAASSAGSSRCSRPPAQMLAVAGIGLDGLQPPGSTFKIVTLTGVLQRRTSRRRTPCSPTPPTRRSTACKLNNANGEELRRLARTRLRGLVQLGVHAARRQARRRRAWSRRPNASASTSDPAIAGRARRARCRAASADPGRTRARLDGDRPGPGAGDARCRWRSSPPTIADGGRRPRADVRAGRAAGRRAGASSAGGRAHGAPPDDRGRARGHRAPRRRSPAWRWPARPAPPN